MKKTHLTSATILARKFSTQSTGYNAKEVDGFLDEVIADYELFESNAQELRQRNETLTKQLSEHDDTLQRLRLEIEQLRSYLKHDAPHLQKDGKTHNK